MTSIPKVSRALIDDLKKFYALPPYDKDMNLCRYDGYFMASLKQQYGEEMVRVADAQLQPLTQSWEQAQRTLSRSFLKKTD